MIDQKIVELLKLFNMTEYESKTYLALVMRGPSTVKEIRELAEIPYSREYDTLQNLMKRGYVELQPSKPKRFRAVNPEIVLGRELGLRKDAVEELLNRLVPIYDSSSKLEAPQDILWTIQGTDNIRDKMVHMISNAKKEILFIGIKPISTHEIQDALRNAYLRDVRIRALGMFDEICRDKLAEVGAESHFYNHDHSRFFVIDDREMILASGDPANDQFAIYNKNPGCIKLYKNIFEHIWNEVEMGKGQELKIKDGLKETVH